MPSKVQIANAALSTYLGKGRINSLDEHNPTALQVEMHYDQAREELLSEWGWTFATKRAPLAKMAINDIPEFASKFALPAKMIRLNWVNEPGAAKAAIIDRRIDDTPRLVQGSFLYSDLEAAWAEFVFDLDDPTVYPAKFAAALSALLASKIAIALTETASKQQAAVAAYEQLLDEAKIHDLRSETPIRVIRENNWQELR